MDLEQIKKEYKSAQKKVSQLREEIYSILADYQLPEHSFCFEVNGKTSPDGTQNLRGYLCRRISTQLSSVIESLELQIVRTETQCNFYIYLNGKKLQTYMERYPHVNLPCEASQEGQVYDFTIYLNSALQQILRQE
ncbi:hypothetical protein pv_167 [Pithovirus sibericum]|uniref:Uncharacterized protein n=1 Tax=Pithovirus sibericum TaxID=1450746 RepID=W5S501_9VIRU|nr:hypothetical protein pv_167 [Pithovirus sibericum]AHH01734.1 hypothetical protein pv_167 [Pithovirus sibericum]WIL05305.1 hypothetical protein pmam_266 [Pithovirus mammoth]